MPLWNCNLLSHASTHRKNIFDFQPFSTFGKPRPLLLAAHTFAVARRALGPGRSSSHVHPRAQSLSTEFIFGVRANCGDGPDDLLPGILGAIRMWDTTYREVLGVFTLFELCTRLQSCRKKLDKSIEKGDSDIVCKWSWKIVARETLCMYTSALLSCGRPFSSKCFSFPAY